jgi:hypothetical protein
MNKPGRSYLDTVPSESAYSFPFIAMPIATTHEVKPGDTFARLAAKHQISLSELLDANPQITNPNLMVVGQLLAVPAQSATINALAAGYDGSTPAPGTIETNAAKPITPPVTNTEAVRSAASYDEVINQFAVGYNPRYRPRDGNTYCNIFLWDVTSAMHCEVPHWVNAQGNPAPAFQPGAYEMNVNGTVAWLRDHGTQRFGWQLVDAATAQQHANAGRPAVALWRNPTGGHGHTVIIRPGNLLAGRGAATAQAGRLNFNQGHIKESFGNAVPKYYVHA